MSLCDNVRVGERYSMEYRRYKTEIVKMLVNSKIKIVTVRFHSCPRAVKVLVFSTCNSNQNV